MSAKHTKVDHILTAAQNKCQDEPTITTQALHFDLIFRVRKHMTALMDKYVILILY